MIWSQSHGKPLSFFTISLRRLAIRLIPQGSLVCMLQSPFTNRHHGFYWEGMLSPLALSCMARDFGLLWPFVYECFLLRHTQQTLP